MGSSPVGEALRAAIFYVAVLFGVYILGLVSYAAGALVTVLLLYLSYEDFLKTSEESFWNLAKRVPSTIGATLMAVAFHQTLDYLFGGLFFFFLFLAGVDHFFPDTPTPTARRRRRRKRKS
jgi:hypothetical protein